MPHLMIKVLKICYLKTSLVLNNWAQISNSGSLEASVYLMQLALIMKFYSSSFLYCIIAMQWQQNKPNPHLRNFQQRRDDEVALQTLSFTQIEMEFRKRVRNSSNTSLVKKLCMFSCSLFS